MGLPADGYSQTGLRAYNGPASSAPPIAPRRAPDSVRLRSVWGFLVFPLVFGGLGVFTLISFWLPVVESNFAGFDRLVIALVFIGVACVGLRFALRRSLWRRPIYLNGIPAEAMVTARHPNPPLKNEEVVTWTYSVDGQQFDGSAFAHRHSMEDIEVGDAIWVLYDPNDYAKSVEWPAGFVKPEAATAPQDIVQPATPPPSPAPRDTSGVDGIHGLVSIEILMGALFVVFPLFFVCLGLTFLFADDTVWEIRLFGLAFALFPTMHIRAGVRLLRNTIERTFLRQHLYANGTPTPAVVNELTSGRRNTYTLRWTYVVDGERFEGSVTGISADPDQFKPGASIWVVVDSDDPSKSAEWPALTVPLDHFGW